MNIDVYNLTAIDKNKLLGDNILNFFLQYPTYSTILLFSDVSLLES